MLNYSLLVQLTFMIPILGLFVELILRQWPTYYLWGQYALTAVWLLAVGYLFWNFQAPFDLNMGQWPYGIAISLHVDLLSTLMLFVFSFVAVIILIYSNYDPYLLLRRHAFYCGFWLLMLGTMGLLLTADLFNFYVWTEVILVSAIILLSSTTRRKYTQLMHYAIFNIIGTLLMLSAIAMIYGKTGTLNIQAIAKILQQSSDANTAVMLFVFSLGIKGAFFPLYFWLPKAYPNTCISSLMLLSSIATKLIIVVCLKFFWLWSPLSSSVVKTLFLGCACATMFFGVVGAANQTRLRHILSFHIVSQLGYLIFALSLPAPINHVALLYFLIHNILVKTNLFMVTGMIEESYQTDNLNKLGELTRDTLFLPGLFLLSALSLAGFPPFSGFWGKYLILKSAIDQGYFVSALIAIVVSLFTLYSMIKIWRYAFCEQAAHEHEFQRESIHYTQILCSVVLLASSLAIALSPDWLFAILARVH